MNSSHTLIGTHGTKERIPISLFSLTVGAFAIGMTEFVIMGLLPNVAVDLDVSIPQAGQLITSYALGVAFGAPVLAVLTHRLPQKKLLCLLMVIFILGNAIAAAAPSYSVLMIARLITALAHGTFFGVGSVIASNLVRPEKRAGAVSMMMAGLTVANIIGVPFGTFIGQQLGWRSSFGAIVIMGIITLIGIITFIPHIKQEKQSSLLQQLNALAQPRLIIVLLIGALGTGGLFTVFTYIAPLLEQVTGFSEHSVTWLLVLFGCGVTIGNIVGGKLADWKLMPTIMVNLLILAVILAVFTFTVWNSTTAVITIFIWGVAAFGIFPGLQVRIMTLAKEAPALASTSNHSVLNLGNAGGAFFGGWTITHMGLPSLPWIASLLTVLALLLAIVSYSLDRGAKSVRNRT
jgi:DHA1 family inner membrane transport protein